MSEQCNVWEPEDPGYSVGPTGQCELRKGHEGKHRRWLSGSRAYAYWEVKPTYNELEQALADERARATRAAGWVVQVQAERDAAIARATEAERWKNTLIDSAVVHWCLNEENKDDPYKMLTDVLNTAIAWENDPAISETAERRQAERDAANARIRELEGQGRSRSWEKGNA